MSMRVFVRYELPKPITPNSLPTKAHYKQMTRQRTTNTHTLKQKVRVLQQDEWSSG
jgi:hypothetical protein